MKHRRIIVDHYGGLDALQLLEEDLPEPPLVQKLHRLVHRLRRAALRAVEANAVGPPGSFDEPAALHQDVAQRLLDHIETHSP